MQALIYTGPGNLEWQERPDLSVSSAFEAIVRPIACSTCDLDRRIVAGRTPFQPPFAIGHEAVGEVLEIGDRVRSCTPGDLVVIPWHICCGVCRTCRRGLPAHCEANAGLSGYGVATASDWGGLFSEQVRVPFADAMLHALPAGIDPVAVASAGDNLTDAYIGVSTGLLKHPGAPVLVMNGIDSLGLFAAEHALALGASRVDFVDSRELQFEAAKMIGATAHRTLPDSFFGVYPVVIGATRDPQQLRRAALCLAPGGHLSNVSIFMEDVAIPYWEMYVKGVSISFGLPNVGPNIPEVLRLARCGHIHPERLVTVFEPKDAAEALMSDVIKPVIVRDRLIGCPDLKAAPRRA